MTCPDYYNYLQLSLFPRSIQDEKIRRKFRPEIRVGAVDPVSKTPEQMSWLKKTDPSFSA